ncbi:hypothetical protein [Azospirillum baldaniorum]|uniref:hypothetical protein n=1 Tax=Azospirillum baldaniorum TaxID=1064539 RepID=UPI001013D6D8|nr:hypothetical protein [Azospirillum baldaniorum]
MPWIDARSNQMGQFLLQPSTKRIFVKPNFDIPLIVNQTYATFRCIQCDARRISVSFFDNFADPYFKTGVTGQRIYYPFGIFGRGRILEEEAEERRLRAIIKFAFIASVAVYAVLFSASFSFWVRMPALCGVVVVQYASHYMPVRTHRVSAERMSLVESWLISARGIGRRTLWVLFFLSVLMTVVGVFVTFVGEGGIWDRLTLLLGAAFFGACSLVYLWMIRQAGRKNRQP